jgi:site-specific recombinase XerD
MGELKVINTQDFGITTFLNNQTSIHTKTAYERDLKDFYEFLAEKLLIVTHPSQLSMSIFLMYRDSLLEKKLASKTVNRKVACIKSLMKWFHVNGHITNNPLNSLKMPKAQVESPTQALTDEEVVRVFQACETLKEKLIFQLLFKLGLRRSEVLNISINNITQFREHTILQIKGKGAKVRELPLSIELLALIQAFIKSEGCIDKLFDISESTLYRTVKATFKRAGITKEVSPHSCRATVISHLLDTQQIPIRDVADFAGHASVNTTSLYDKKRKGLENSPVYKINYGGKL